MLVESRDWFVSSTICVVMVGLKTHDAQKVGNTLYLEWQTLYYTIIRPSNMVSMDIRDVFFVCVLLLVFPFCPKTLDENSISTRNLCEIPSIWGLYLLFAAFYCRRQCAFCTIRGQNCVIYIMRIAIVVKKRSRVEIY